ncbi:hypothetical protein KKC60_05905 [Patescibacteria group bacterium]|nr:hypothetical protein [Patescibacteria group bacterium]
MVFTIGAVWSVKKYLDQKRLQIDENEISPALERLKKIVSLLSRLLKVIADFFVFLLKKLWSVLEPRSGFAVRAWEWIKEKWEVLIHWLRSKKKWLRITAAVAATVGFLALISLGVLLFIAMFSGGTKKSSAGHKLLKREVVTAVSLSKKLESLETLTQRLKIDLGIAKVKIASHRQELIRLRQWLTNERKIRLKLQAGLRRKNDAKTAASWRWKAIKTLRLKSKRKRVAKKRKKRRRKIEIDDGNEGIGQ